MLFLFSGWLSKIHSRIWCMCADKRVHSVWLHRLYGVGILAVKHSHSYEHAVYFQLRLPSTKVVPKAILLCMHQFLEIILGKQHENSVSQLTLVH